MFGGIAFVGGTHGNIFYPTTWLQWFMPTDTGMNLAFLIHFVIVGLSLYLLARALGASWTGAVVAGLGYELTGIVASLVKPDTTASSSSPHSHHSLPGTLACATAPETRRLRHRCPDHRSQYSRPLPAGYYLLVAGGLWALCSPSRPRESRSQGLATAPGGALAAVLLGVGIAAIRVLPLLDYIPYSPRAEGGPSAGGLTHGLRHADQ
jgi:hypothetical protein